MPPHKRPTPPARAPHPYNPASLKKLIDTYDEGNVAAAARRVGVAQPVLWKMLAGRTNPRSETLARIAEAYGVTRDWLYSGDRTADDTYEVGAREIIRQLRRELDRLEGDLTPARESFIRPAPRSAPVNQVPLLTTDQTVRRVAEPSAGFVEKPKKKPKKRA